jgi:CheY-like chemotaxis protein
MTVLVVEDDADVRESLAEFFEQEGLSVETATNGQEALQRLAAAPPCVVILDLLMPVMGGAEVYERMQGDARLKAVPVIISTSDPSRAPAGSVIMKKPIDLDRLLEMVRGFCS